MSIQKLKIYWNILSFYRGEFIVILLSFVFLIPLFIENMILQNLASGIAMALLGFSGATWQATYKSRQNEFTEIQSALSYFESLRVNLLTLKGQFIKPALEELSNFEEEQKIDLGKLKSLTHEQLNAWKNLKHVFTFYKELNFYDGSLSKLLSFIAKKKPELLVLLNFSYQCFLEANQQIQSRNSVLSEYREKSLYSNEKTGDKFFITHMWTCKVFLKGLDEIIDDCIEFHRYSSKHLIDYTKSSYFLPKKRIFQKKICTKYETLMPKDDLLKDLIKEIMGDEV